MMGLRHIMLARLISPPISLAVPVTPITQTHSIFELLRIMPFLKRLDDAIDAGEKAIQLIRTM